jgi:SAM-dependent methyltransferase
LKPTPSNHAANASFDAVTDYAYDGGDLESLAGLVHYRNWIVDFFRPYLRGHAVEFGPGRGDISVLVAPLVDKLDLVEPSPTLAPGLAHRFADDARVTVHTESLDRFAANAAGEYDAAILVNVLEHIEDDDVALAHLYAALKPGGYVMIMVPALQFLYSALDAKVGHYRRYHLAALRRQAEAAGFEPVFARYFDTFGILPWWLLNRVMGATGFNPALASIYDRFFVPPGRALERLIPPPAGKNIALVARRPADSD